MTLCDEFALSDAQKALWTAQSLDASGTAYRVPLMITLRGPLDRARLTQAVGQLVQRHEALRTTFVLGPDGPVQRVQAEAQPLIESLELSGAAALPDFVADQLARPLDPAQQTLRCVLARCEPTLHLLFLDLHHLVCDGASMPLLAADLQALYRGDLLPELDYQYVDWSEWKASTPDDPEARQFWRQRLAVLAPPPPLFPTCAGDPSRAHTLQAPIEPAAWQAIVQAARNAGLTPYEWLLAGLGAYFSPALSPGQPLVVAVPWFNREREEFQHTVGCFVDTALISLAPAADVPLAPQLPALARSMREHLGHAGLGWNRLSALWREAWPTQASAEPRLLFVLQEPQPALDGLPGLSLQVEAPPNGGAKYDLALRIDRQHGQALLTLEYRETALSRADAQAVLHDLPAQWLALAQAPDRCTGQLPRRWQPSAAAPLSASHPSPLSAPAAGTGAAGTPRPPADPDTEALMQRLCQQWAHTLGLPQVGPDDNFFALGGDSILALRLVAQLREQGLHIKPRALFQHPSPRALATAQQAPAPVQAARADAAPVGTGLLPIEDWFFRLDLPHPEHWNQALALRLPAGTDSLALQQALQQVHQAHPAFGLRWGRDPAGQPILLTQQAERSYAWLPVPAEGPETEQAAQAQARIHLSHGPLSALCWCEATGRLLWWVHHLVVDAVSWAILVKDLGRALQGETLPPAAASSRAARLRSAAQAASAQALALWQQQQPPQAEAQLPDEPGRYGQQQRQQLSLEPDWLAQAQPLVQAGFSLEEVLLAATARLLGRESGQHSARLTLEHHGRDADSEQAASETGWFTVLAPWQLSWAAEADNLDLLSEVVPSLARWRRDAPQWLPCAQRAASTGLSLPGVSFNYLGRLDGDAAQGLSVEPLPDLALHDPQGRRPFSHELLAWQGGGQLHLAWLAPGSLPTAQVQGWLQGLREELWRLVRQAAAQGPRLPAGPLAPGLLYHHDDAGQTEAAYVEQVCATLEGPIDADRLRLAWQRCSQRHDALRTAFRDSADGVLRRVLLADAPMPFKQLDLRASGAQATALLEQAFAQERRQRFDPAEAPLGRVLLVQLQEQHWQLAFTHHHAILDGWSLPRLLEDLLTAYAGPLPAHGTAPGALAVVRAQAGQDEPALQAEWRQLLGSPLAGPAAPEQPELALRSLQPQPDADLDLVLEPALSERIVSRAAELGVSPTTWFLAAWALALQSVGLGRRPVFGLTVSGRQGELPGIERHVGLTANTLPMVLDTAPTLPFSALLAQAQTRSALLQASAHLSLSELHRLAGRPGEALFETLFVFENYPSGRMQGPEFSVTGVHMREQAHYPLALAVLPGPSTTLRLALRAGRVSQATGHALLEGLASVLRLSSWRPELSCAALRFHDAGTLGRLLQAGRAAPATAAQDSLYALLSRAAHTWPQATAVHSDALQWDYATLLARARHFGLALRQRGLQAGQCVALMCLRSPDWIAALYGASFAGLAFVCIDSALPAQRQIDMVRRSHAALWLLDGLPQPQAPGPSGPEDATALPPALTLQELAAWPAPADSADAQPSPGVPASLAYVVYTSGSTGRPKVVGVPQRGLHNLAQAQARNAGLASGDRVYQFASPSFDAAVSEIAMTAWAGATLCLPAQGLPIPQIDFVADLARCQPSHITLPPSLAASLEPADFPGLRTLLVAGERSSARQLQALRAAGCQVINAYGPSEATVCTTMGLWQQAGDPDLGAPIDGFEVLVLDPQGQPCLPGVAGELAIGGVGLAWGYLGDPARTAAAFVPHPWPSQPGERLYLSGDRVLRDEHGQLVFLGRKDRQIKLRGQRIELGEIEACLAALECVQSARADVLGQGASAQLVAWLQAPAEAPLDLHDCARQVALRLPAAMVPQAWAQLAQWPLNALGKVDPARLPEPAVLRQRGHAPGPQADADSPLLGPVLALWRDALGPQVEADYDFYQAGGDSISAMRVSARLAALGLSVKARDLLAGLSPRQIAALASAPDPANQAGHPAAHLPAAPPSEAALTPIQARLLRHWQGQVPRWLLSLDLKLHPGLDLDALATALATVAARHDALQLGLAADEGLQRRLDAPALCLRRGQPESPETLVQQVRQDLAARHYQGLAAALCEGPQPLLHLSVHHLWMDVVSLRLLVDEITEQLQSPALRRPPATSFLGWAEALRAAAEAGQFDAELPFWLHTLQPAAGPHTPILLASDSASGLPTEAEVTRQLQVLTLPEALPDERSLEALLLQSLAQGLAPPGQGLLVECESHGRHALASWDASSTLGWFTAYYPLRLQASPQPARQAAELARQIAALPAGGAGFSALQRWRQGLSGAEGLQAFDSACALSFNYLGALDRPAGSAVHPLGELQTTARDDVAPDLRRLRPIALEAWREGRQLSLRWTWQAEHWPQAGDALARVVAALQPLLTQAAPAPTAEPALSNDLDDDELSDLMSALNG